VVVKDPTREAQQVTDERIPDGIPHGHPFLPRRHDVLAAEDGQLLRNDRLIERERLLEFLDSAPPSHEQFQHADSDGMRQRTEEQSFESL
jgi:hypothetical protein